MNMGSIRSGQFQRSESTPPWAWEVFGQPGLIDSMLQEAALGSRDPESAWKDTIAKIENAVNGWKISHPG